MIAATGLTPDVRGISGSGVRDDLRDWFPAAKAIGQGCPSVVVVGLGANDAVMAEDADAFAGRAELLLQALGSVPVVWVTHTEAGDPARDPANERRVASASGLSTSSPPGFPSRTSGPCPRRSASGGSTATCGNARSSQPGSHQVARP